MSNALLVSAGPDYAVRSGLFAPSSAAPVQQLTFDFRLAADIGDYAGKPGVDIQDAVMQVRGPDANARNEFFLVYKADTDSGGNVVLNQIQLRGAGSTFGNAPRVGSGRRSRAPASRS